MQTVTKKKKKKVKKKNIMYGYHKMKKLSTSLLLAYYIRVRFSHSASKMFHHNMG